MIKFFASTLLEVREIGQLYCSLPGLIITHLTNDRYLVIGYDNNLVLAWLSDIQLNQCVYFKCFCNLWNQIHQTLYMLTKEFFVKGVDYLSIIDTCIRTRPAGKWSFLKKKILKIIYEKAHSHISRTFSLVSFRRLQHSIF